MITYGFSIQGKSHVEKGTVCQDANKILKLKNGWYVAAIADGVGSAKHSEIGSQMAVEKFVEYCETKLPIKMDISKVKVIIEEAYHYALNSIGDYIDKCGGRIEEYDTTLSTVVYDGKTVVYGHAGDGGILVRLMDGRIVPVTERQKGIDGTSVRPLRAGENSWDFGACKKEVASVLLSTDGILDEVLMPYLLNLPEDGDILQLHKVKKNHTYITSAQFLMDSNSIFKNKAIWDAEEYLEHFISGKFTEEDKGKFLMCLQNAYLQMFSKVEAEKICDSVAKYHYPIWSMGRVTDDKTIVCLINEKSKVKHLEIDDYMEPDWRSLQTRYEELAYPGMNRTKQKEETKEKVSKQEKKSLCIDKEERNSGKVSKRIEDSICVERIYQKEKSETPNYSKKAIIKRTIDILAMLTIIILLGAVITLSVKLSKTENEKSMVTTQEILEKKESVTPKSAQKVEDVECLSDDELVKALEEQLDKSEELWKEGISRLEKDSVDVSFEQKLNRVWSQIEESWEEIQESIPQEGKEEKPAYTMKPTSEPTASSKSNIKNRKSFQNEKK